MTMEDRIKDLREVRAKALLGGGPEEIRKVHEKGKLTARERIDRLLDPGSFLEWNLLSGNSEGAPDDGIVTGYGTIGGRTVCIFSQDRTVLSGTMGPFLHGYKMYRTIQRALEMKVPLIGLYDSPGWRVVRPDDTSTASETRTVNTGQAIFFIHTRASGVVPQISAVLGPCAGMSVYGPALTDFIFMVDDMSQMFITGPRIVKATVGEDVSAEDLGGTKVHSRVSGVNDFRVRNEDECFAGIKHLLSFLPSNSDEKPPVVETGDDPDRTDDTLAGIVPADSRKSYDMRKVIRALADDGDFLEVKAEFASEIIVGFGRLGGQAVGFVANQPLVRAGSLTIDSSDKEARFIRFCDAFNIPIVLLVDTPAYLPGTQQEHGGIIRHGAKVLYALCEATVPRVAVVLRKCYGGGNAGMGTNPGFGTDFVYYWPIVETGVIGPEQSVEVFYAREMAAAPDPEEYKALKAKAYRDKYANPLLRASVDPYVEDVIEPGETRRVLIKSLKLLRTKSVPAQPKRHGNMPM